jgi:hypothetical protein
MIVGLLAGIHPSCVKSNYTTLEAKIAKVSCKFKLSLGCSNSYPFQHATAQRNVTVAA